MVNATGKPDTLKVKIQRMELVCIMVYSKIRIDDLQGLADAKVVAPELVKRDVPTVKCSFGKIINQLLLR